MPRLDGVLFQRPGEMGFGFGKSAEIGQRHAQKHAALDRVGLQSPCLLEEFGSLVQVSTALEGHSPREKPGVEIAGALSADLGVKALGLVMLVGLVKGECFLEQGIALFLIHYRVATGGAPVLVFSFRCVYSNENSPRLKMKKSQRKLGLVAGVGFEPTTFRL